MNTDEEKQLKKQMEEIECRISIGLCNEAMLAAALNENLPLNEAMTLGKPLGGGIDAPNTGGAAQTGADGVPPALTAGQTAEAAILNALGSGGKVSFTPTQAQIDSAAFQLTVGNAKYTSQGIPVGTVYDATIGDGVGEIKTGTSTLDSSYQLRLQTYGSLVNDIPLTIYTNRPINPTFSNWLNNWGVTIQPLPK